MVHLEVIMRKSRWSLFAATLLAGLSAVGAAQATDNNYSQSSVCNEANTGWTVTTTCTKTIGDP
jgi:hypothetical protein